MATLTDLPRTAKAYWLLVILAGCICFIRAMAGWTFTESSLFVFAVYLIAAIATSGLKIHLPGIFGTLSMSFVVIIMTLQDLSVGDGMIVAIIGTLSQCIIHTKSRPRWFQVLFSVGGMPVPVLAANLALKSALLAQIDHTGSIGILAASMSYFALNTITVAGVIACSTGKPVYGTWRDSYLWTFPQYLVGGGLAWATHALGHNWGWPALLMALPPLYLLYRTYSIYLERVAEQQKHILEMSDLHLRTIETLALAIDAKDDTTAAHLHRVQVYASEIGKELKLSAREMQALQAAALLHDVGKLAVPEYIVSKPGKLTEEEFEKMKVHPVVGAEILERVKFPYPVVPIVRSHHEKYDGTGYPDGLSGDQIPIGARILSAVDCLDALASARQYRPALPLETAMNMVAAQSGKSYDPTVVAILQRRYRELELKAKAETVDVVKLSSNVKIERGDAPAAGFAEPESSEVGRMAQLPARDFSFSIAAARREFQLLIEVTNELGNSLSLDETIALLAVRVAKIVKHDSIAIFLAQEGKLIPRYVKGESFRLFSSLQIPVGHGLSGWVAENNLPIVNGNPAVEPGYLNGPRLVTPLRSAISVPLRGQDRTVGVLTLYSLGSSSFSADDKRMLLAIGPKAGHAIENSLRFELARNAADTDELTGLMNAGSLFRCLEQQVARSSRSGEDFNLVLLDLDEFKRANDEHGHLAGNRILRAVAAELQRNCRAGDVVARLGGDEFVLVLPTAGGLAENTLSRIEEAFGRLAFETGCDAEIGFSAGISCYPRDGLDAESLLEKADARMYEAKARKRQKRLLKTQSEQTVGVAAVA